MGVYTHSDGNWLTRRGAFLVGLIAFHIVLLWALKSGFAVKFIESIAPPIVAEIINEVKPDEPPPPPPPVKMELPPVSVPPVVVNIQMPVDVPATALTVVTDKPPTPQPPPPPPPPRQISRTPLKVDANRSNVNIDDFYPQSSLANEEQGVVRVSVCVGANGRAKEASLAETSGFPRLDEAGVKVARQLRYIPQTIDGKAADACGQVPIRFNLPKR
jgi:periplasmic protein TonB